MLDKVEVRNDQGSMLTLSLQDLSNGFIVEEIQGLEPVKANIVSSSFAQLDGEQYQSARREKRNLILMLALAPDFVNTTVQILKDTLYKYFMPKQHVRLRFYSTGQPTVEIEGWIESFVAPKFTKDPQATISILCFNPDFVNTTPVTVAGQTTASTTTQLVTYSGTVETGFVLKLAVNRALTAFTIFNTAPDGSLRSLDFQSAIALQAGDVVEISTQSGNKYASLTRAGVKTSILYSISPQSNWINFFPGANQLRIYAGGAAIPYSIEYTTKFGAL